MIKVGALASGTKRGCSCGGYAKRDGSGGGVGARRSENSLHSIKD